MSFGDTSRGFSEWSLGGIDLTLDDFDRIGSHVPLLVDLQLAGRFLMDTSTALAARSSAGGARSPRSVAPWLPCPPCVAKHLAAHRSWPCNGVEALCASASDPKE
jgi:hypothetical protein